MAWDRRRGNERTDPVKTSQTRLKSKGGIALLVIIGALVVFAFTAAHLAARLSPLTGTWVIKALRERYQSDVHLRKLTVTLWPHPRVSGEGLVLQPKDLIRRTTMTEAAHCQAL